jgi:hypothetical protein
LLVSPFVEVAVPHARYPYDDASAIQFNDDITK